MSGKSGISHRGESIPVDRMHVGAPAAQQIHQISRASRGGIHQSCLSLVAFDVEVRAAFHKDSSDLRPPMFRDQNESGVTQGSPCIELCISRSRKQAYRLLILPFDDRLGRCVRNPCEEAPILPSSY